MYADEITDSMKKMIDETKRRRKIQKKYNKKHNIKPETIRKEINYSSLLSYRTKGEKKDEINIDIVEHEDIPQLIKKLKARMEEKSEKLLFEEAAKIRDKIYELQERYEDDIKI